MAESGLRRRPSVLHPDLELDHDRIPNGRFDVAGLLPWVIHMGWPMATSQHLEGCVLAELDREFLMHPSWSVGVVLSGISMGVATLLLPTDEAIRDSPSISVEQRGISGGATRSDVGR